MKLFLSAPSRLRLRASAHRNPPRAFEALEPRTHLSVTQSSDGWTEFTHTDADRTIYVSSSQGSDDNAGTSTTRPVATLAKAISLLRDGHGDWMLLKNGDVWYENIPDWTKSGESADNPMLIGAYGPGDRPVLETANQSGIAFGNMTIKHVALNGIFFHANTRDPESPDYVSPDGGKYGSFGFHSAFPVDDIQIENCVFKSYQFNVTIEGQFGAGGNVKLRRNTATAATRRCWRLSTARMMVFLPPSSPVNRVVEIR